tara:strand:+ start:1089 stop:1643 length:555 start_codon:yes stop_codon:yes gene_type:complete
MIRLTFCLALFSGPALADPCADLWFSRNQTMNQAGYCFGSNLGQALFDNADCTGKTVTLTPEQSRIVAQVKAIEKEVGCKVDTTSHRIDLEDLAVRRQLTVQPVLDEFPSGCVGWTGGQIRLHAGTSNATQVIGSAQTGDNIYFIHSPQNGFSYVTVTDSNFAAKSGGWLRDGFDPALCTQNLP